MRNWLKKFKSDERGAASLEFVIIAAPLFLLVLFTMQIAISYHWALSAQKAIETAARVAATQRPVVEELMETNDYGTMMILRSVADGGSYGGACYDGNCVAVADYSCTGGDQLNATPGSTCNAERFATIMNTVNSLTYDVDDEDVTVTYQDMDLGYAGVGYVPVITLTIASRPLTSALSIFGMETTLPEVSSTIVMEGTLQ